MNSETMKQVIKEILPDDIDSLDRYIRDQAKMVLAKRCILKDLDPDKDIELIELEAMLLASSVQIGLIDACVRGGVL